MEKVSLYFQGSFLINLLRCCVDSRGGGHPHQIPSQPSQGVTVTLLAGGDVFLHFSIRPEVISSTALCVVPFRCQLIPGSFPPGPILLCSSVFLGPVGAWEIHPNSLLVNYSTGFQKDGGWRELPVRNRVISLKLLPQQLRCSILEHQSAQV